MAEGGRENKRKAPALNAENILHFLVEIQWKWNSLGIILNVPEEIRDGILTNNISDFDRLKEVLEYMLRFHPFASWRVIIDALLVMEEHYLAASIKEFSEPVTDTSLTVENVVGVMNKMKSNWYGLLSLSSHLDIPVSMRDEIKQIYQSQSKQHAALANYCISLVPGFSWSRLAGAFYFLDEKVALEAAKQYFKKDKQDVNLTLCNLLTVLEKVTDWNMLAIWLELPWSVRSMLSDKESVLSEWLYGHPAPSWELLAWVLYGKGSAQYLTESHNMLKMIYTKYILAPDIKSKVNACQQAITEKGAIEQTVVQGVFIGHPRSGKTSSKRRMVGKKAKVDQVSTGVAEKVTRVEIEKSTVVSNWKEVTGLNEETAIVVEDVVDHVSTTVQQEAGQSDIINLRDDDKIPDDQNSNLFRDIAHKVKAIFTRKKSTVLFEIIESEAKKRKENSDALRILSTALQSATQFPSLSLGKQQKEWTLYLSDVGGQTEFQELLPSLVSGPSIYFLTFPLHKGLNERFKVEYQHPTNGNIVPVESVSSNKEVLLQSLSSITSTRSYITALKGKPVSPKVLIIGTHRDKIHEQHLIEIDQQLQIIIKKTSAYKENMIIFCSESQMLFAVDNTSDDDADIQQVRDAVDRLAISTDDYKIQTPYTWMLFAVTLRHLPERVLSFEKCLEIGKECGIDTKEELNNALWFLHHNVGIIRHFQDHPELRDVVIKEPQYIFDKVTELIIKTFTFQNVGPYVHEEFIKKGIFPVNIVQILSTESDTLTGEQFAALLEHHHIIAPIEDNGKIVKYFAPCALAHAELPSDAKSPDIIPPLLVVFESGYCPKGIFGALVVNLLKKSTFELKEDKIYRDQLCLSVSPHYDSFQLFLSPTSIRIALHSTIEQNRKITLGRICNHVRCEIDESIRSVVDLLHYTERAAHSFALSCPEPHPYDESHGATINFSPKGEPCTLTCPFSKKVYSFPDGEHKVWFDEDICLQMRSDTYNSATSSDIPTMSELTSFTCSDGSRVNIAVEVSTSYFDFGVQLLDDPSGAIVRNIEHAKHRDPKEINTEILIEWLKGGGRLPVTWSALVKALKSIGKGELAEQIRKMKSKSRSAVNCL